MGHVQNSPVSTNIISIYHMYTWVGIVLAPKKLSKSKIHILPIYEQNGPQNGYSVKLALQLFQL